MQYFPVSGDRKDLCGESDDDIWYLLLYSYCINIGFYLVLKAKKLPVRDHPVMERLVQYQKVSE